MEQKIYSILKSSILIFLSFLLFFRIFILSIIIQFDDQSVMELLSMFVWYAIYLALPIGAFVTTVIMICKQKPFRFVIIPFIAYLIIAGGCFLSSHLYFSEFSGEKWQNHPRARHLMIDDITEEYMLIGITKSEVINLLGEGDYPYADAGGLDLIDYYTYDGFIDPIMFTVVFENDEVVDVYKYSEYRSNKIPVY